MFTCPSTGLITWAANIPDKYINKSIPIKRFAIASLRIVLHIFSSESNENKINDRMKLVKHINVPMNDDKPGWIFDPGSEAVRILQLWLKGSQLILSFFFPFRSNRKCQENQTISLHRDEQMTMKTKFIAKYTEFYQWKGTYIKENKLTFAVLWK